MKFSDLAERQILKAQAEGQLDNLKGAGKPLQHSDGTGDFAEAAGFRIMAEAGAVPKEIELKKAVAAQLEVLKATVDPAARKEEMRKLADLQLKLAIQEEARRKYYSG
ncbi:DnaJ family domain-containing protein [Chachezhania sediminis]|uniref:DnaJ family domain-containing protein n=1 Tax=Chachezhania sediminis TaxID=2599291 RepID=UPI00131D3CA0|nr:DUF1992 domain-containing protein [Chachezhania sediminis]